LSEGTLRIVSLNGLLGYGYPRESLQRALAMEPDLLGVDAGSTDPGPYYLGAGESFVSDAQVRSDLEPALRAAVEHGLPLIVGTAGGSGGAPHLKGLLEIVREIARRNSLRFRMAVIPAEVPQAAVLEALREGRVTSCGPADELTEEHVRACTRIVGQMGTEPLIEALDGGAQVVIAARCCDAGIFAAEPIRRGFDPGLALHMGKILECGTLAARPAGANDVLVGTIGPGWFEVEPANPAKRCTPESVAAHSLYEQPDPNCFYEPEGMVDLSACEFEQAGERAVRVTGSRLVPAQEQTVKLEGARPCGFRAITIAGVRDPLIIERLGEIERSVQAAVASAMDGTLAAEEFSVRFIRYGLDGVTGGIEPPPEPHPREVGLVIDALAPTQELADRVLKLARSTALHQHFDGRKTTAGNLAFPFSPSDFSGGAVYEFAVHHLMSVADPRALFPVAFEEVG
jgi:hypothetical protein